MVEMKKEFEFLDFKWIFSKWHYILINLIVWFDIILRRRVLGFELVISYLFLSYIFITLIYFVSRYILHRAEEEDIKSANS